MTDQKPVAAAQPVAEQPSPHPAKQAGGGEVAAKPQAVQYLNAAILRHLDQLFKSYASAEHSWGPHETSNFFTKIQHDASIPAPAQTAPQAPSGVVKSADFDFHAFLDYMSSPASGVIRPAAEQDLSYPLSSYFISSSHNTYLTGNQLSSDASTDAYRNVLLRGCRCIEIDVWDGEGVESGSDSSASTSSGDDGVGDKDRDAKKQKNAERLERARSVALSVKERLPSELAARLEKTKLGKRFERFVGKKMDAKPPGKDSAAATTANTAPTASAATGAATAQRPSAHRAISAADEPRVLHGHTLTKEVPFRAVCQAIKENAFVATDLPLVVSLEVHCNAQQQQLMVNIMKETWGNMLLAEPDGDALKHKRPSPNDLRKKILIKVKYIKPSDVPTQVPSNSAGGDAAPEGKELAKEVKSEAKAAGNSELKKAAEKKNQKPSKIIQALSELGIYTRGVSFKSLSQPEATMPGHVFSVSEKGIIEVHERDSAGLFHHNRHFLMRAYPSGLRFLSTNLDPVPYWRKGVQMVALNWQVWDEGMMLNEGMFAGSKGYVLKPEGMSHG
jgi:phosphatidylinositol phospholipase C, delta